MSLQNLADQAHSALLNGRAVGVLGFGTQGSAHARNLRDSGVSVLVGQRSGGAGETAAREAGFEVLPISDVARRADLLIFGLPDEQTPEVYSEQIRPHLRPGQTLGFMHGYVVTYRLIEWPPRVDVVLVAPKGQGRAVRRHFEAGGGVASLVAIEQDASGNALQTALGWAAGIGSHRSAILRTTFREETETDLFGEQAVLCGGMSALVQAGFETLVNAGYAPELAYIECCHELKLVVDLVHAHGIQGMRRRISSTARYGDRTRGPRVIDEHVRQSLAAILAEIRQGRFAQELQAAGDAIRADGTNRSSAEDPCGMDGVGQAVRKLLHNRGISE